jgi:hypothetical protein
MVADSAKLKLIESDRLKIPRMEILSARERFKLSDALSKPVRVMVSVVLMFRVSEVFFSVTATAGS